MNLETYPVKASKDYKRYEFFSEGPKGTIKKVVLYQYMGENIYNLSFGDWDEVKQGINDSIRTNNNDHNIVIATVASTVIDFIKHYPHALVSARGSTAGRTRLYQMRIAENWHIIGKLFYMEGLYNGQWEPFIKGRNYQAFLLTIR